MGVIQAVVTVCGVFGIIGLLLILFCHYFQGWTWTTNYIFNSTKEEKMVLTKPGHYNSNGCMIPSSESDFHLSGRGSFRRFEKTDQDYSLLRQGSCTSLTRPLSNLPPQPLRPAPIPPYITGPLRSQSSVDSVFSSGSPPPSFLPPPHIHRKDRIPVSSVHFKEEGAEDMASGGFANLSANNPFLPLIQASTQFISQKLQSFQSQPNGANNETLPNTPLPPTQTIASNYDCTKPQTADQEYLKDRNGSVTSARDSSISTSSIPSSGISMGEILFSSPPAYSMPEPDPHPQIENQAQKTQDIIQEMRIQPQTLDSKTEYSALSNEYRNEMESNSGHVHPDVNALKTCRVIDSAFSEKDCQQADSNTGGHLEGKKHGMPNISTKPHYGEHFYSTDHQRSPTRLRDRQRKMELTLQHLQNNQEDRSGGKKHYNSDSCYPTSAPYVPKHVENSGDNSGSINSKSRYRSPYGIGQHSVSPVRKIEEAVDPSHLKMEMSNPIEISDVRNIIEEVEEEEEEEEEVEEMKNEEAKSKSFLETMREEIRLENKRMADATKSLMMEEDFSLENPQNNGTTSGGKKLSQSHFVSSRENSYEKGELGTISTNTKLIQRLSSTEVQGEESTKIPYTCSNNTNGNLNANSNLIFSQSPSKIFDPPVSSAKSCISANSVPTTLPISCAGIGQQLGDGGGSFINHAPVNNIPHMRPAFRNTRSFSLRQSSTDSIGSEGSDVGSPDGSLPSLQRAMSCDSVSSDTSVILGDLEPPHVTGHLCIGLEYDSETADLLVNVIEAKELVGPDPSSVSPFDSYVRVYLLPDKTTNMQTRVYRKSFNPVYREKFMFGLETMELPLRTLVFYLYGTDKHSNTLVGEAELKLGDLDIYQPTITWLQLTDTGQKGGESGEIMFSLSYLPTAERLTVVIVKARTLKFPHQRETGDPFVKVYLLQKGKKVSKKKSSTKRGERNPIFNEAMIFSVPAHTLHTIQLRITVADSSEIEGRAYSVGHVIVGSSATGKSLSHWNQMLASLRKPIAMWHPLRK